MLEPTPKSVPTDDNFRVWFVTAGSNPLSVATLSGPTAKSITYSLIPGGFNQGITEETINDERLTLKQMLERAGTVSQTLEVQYVFGDDDDVASAALVEGVEGFIIPRYAIPNATEPTVGQIVDKIPVTCGKQRKNQPSRNSVWAKTQKLFITGVVEEDVPLVA